MSLQHSDPEQPQLPAPAPVQGAGAGLADVPEFVLEVTPEQVARFLIARDGLIPDHPPGVGERVPVSFLSFLRVQPAACVSLHRLLGRDPDRGMFGSVVYEEPRPVVVGAALRASSRVLERREVAGAHGRLTVTTMRVQWSDRQGIVVTETVRMVDLPPNPGPPAEGDVDDGSLPPAFGPRVFDRVQASWMCVVTGDMNPLHLDATYAASRGFRDVVLPGPLVVAAAERDVQRHVGATAKRFEVRLRAPLFPGEEVTVRAAEEGSSHHFRLVADGRVKAEGWAEFGS